MLDVELVRVVFKDSLGIIEKHDVAITDNGLSLTIHETEEKFSVIPLHNLSHYDVEV